MAPTTTTPTHAIVDLVPTPAPGPGGLPGFDAICTCGTRIGSSLRSLAAEWGRDHVRYYTAKEA